MQVKASFTVHNSELKYVILYTKYAGYLKISTPAVSIEWLLFHLEKIAAMFLSLLRTKLKVPEKHFFFLNL